MPELGLREAMLSDAEAIRNCIASAYAEAMRDIADLPDVTGGIAEDIVNHQVTVAEEGAHLLGVIVFDQMDDSMMIFNLAVSPDAQGRGIARKLLSVAEARAAQHGLTTLRLRTHRLMTSTCAMYRHLGWKEVGTTGDTILMEKQVS